MRHKLSTEECIGGTVWQKRGFVDRSSYFPIGTEIKLVGQKKAQTISEVSLHLKFLGLLRGKASMFLRILVKLRLYRG